MDNISKIEELENNAKSANIIRDENIMLLRSLYESAEAPIKVSIVKTMNDILKSKEDSIINIIKTSLLNADVNSNVDYKKAAVEMLKTISPKDIIPGATLVNPNVDSEIEQRFATSDETIMASELVLED